ncbi:ribonuclease H-like superfamily protein [Vibrio phage vB_ValS_X1]|uniref:Ribonuclease H-like superfamily protein n=1 Tax=Vibrio phage vB_ValS_X1 TaxID=2736341 RepID=A0A6M9Z7T4_9CAUD|nr:ribonuclease H-like superfamily protein [Vibrio phage vB_ValS_X1]
MHIYCDGSATATTKKGTVLSAGWSVVTNSKVFYGHCKAHTTARKNTTTATIPELTALLYALKIAQEGDVIHTDQERLLDELLVKGALGGGKLLRLEQPKWNPGRSRVQHLKFYINELMKKKQGVTIQFTPREQSKYSKGNLPCYLADTFSRLGRDQLLPGELLTKRLKGRKPVYV